MNVRRFEDWPSRLDSFLESRRATPFSYGSHDCCLFAADAVLAITGVDPAASFRNRYKSAFGAMRRMREVCADATVWATARDVFGDLHLPEIDPLFAQRGDVVLVSHSAGESLAVIAPDGWPVAPDDIGWKRSDRAYALTAWRI